MKRMSLAFWVLVVGVAVGVGQTALFGPLLPARVASHFGADGRANGFMERAAFLQTHLVITVVVAALFAAIALGTTRVPTAGLNLPHKEYWLSEERRDQTLAYLRDRFLAFGAATLALLACSMQAVYEANLHGAETLGAGARIALVCYLLYTVVWSVALVQRFSRLPS